MTSITMRKFSLRICAAVAAALLIMFGGADPASAIERRGDQFAGEFAYFVFPFAMQIPGLGSGVGAGATLLNIGDSPTDITALYMDGDLKMSMLMVLNWHLIERRLIFDIGALDMGMAPQSWERGINSSVDNYYRAKIAGRLANAQLTLTFDERRFETYLRQNMGSFRTLSVFDSAGNDLGSTDTAAHDFSASAFGLSYDYTDDRNDPRQGVRFEALRQLPSASDDPYASAFHVTDYNLTGYIPSGEWSTVVLNVFRSDAAITRPGPTDFATLEPVRGLPCEFYTPGSPEETACLAQEVGVIDSLIANNTYGRATPLGGPARLRSYPSGRFFAGHTFFFGAEYRWNMTQEITPFDYFAAKGVRTGMQLAFFHERGTVADDPSQLYSHMRSSTGIGFRMIVSGGALRIDWATGDEGSQMTLFFDYPWGMMPGF